MLQIVVNAKSSQATSAADSYQVQTICQITSDVYSLSHDMI